MMLCNIRAAWILPAQEQMSGKVVLMGPGKNVLTIRCAGWVDPGPFWCEAASDYKNLPTISSYGGFLIQTARTIEYQTSILTTKASARHPSSHAIFGLHRSSCCSFHGRHYSCAEPGLSQLVHTPLSLALDTFPKFPADQPFSYYDNVSIGQCKSFLNGVWAEWFCIDCAGKKHRMRGLGKDACEIPEEIEAPAE